MPRPVGQISRESALPARSRATTFRFMSHRSPLDDPKTAAHAWTRYKRLLRWMAFGTIAIVVVALAVLYAVAGGTVSIHFYIAAALGIGFSVLLTAALMGLVFLSSGTGHDEAVSDTNDRNHSPDGRRR